MKKILLTGSNGLLGQKLISLMVTHPDIKLIATSVGENRHPIKNGYVYDSMDITVPENIEYVINKHQPQFIIHTAALTNVDSCEQEQDKCWLLNVTAVAYLIEVCQKYNIHLIHLSTDFIFDGLNGPYAEEAVANPLSFYGKSKWEAEKLLFNSKIKWTILRTIIVYGIVNDMSRSNIVLWAKSALEKGLPINVVNDQWRMPTLVEDLADICLLAVEKDAQGIYNASGKDMMSIIELVEAVADFYHLDKNLIQPISSASLNQAAARPKKTGFILDKSYRVLDYQPHSFKEGLAILDKQLKEFTV